MRVQIPFLLPRRAIRVLPSKFNQKEKPGPLLSRQILAMKNPLCTLGLDLPRLDPNRCGKPATHQAGISEFTHYSCPNCMGGYYVQFKWVEIPVAQDGVFPKDADGDWDWRKDRQRRPRLIKEDRVTRDEAFERLSKALKSQEGDPAYERTLSDAENAFVAGDYDGMCKCLESIGH